MIGVDTNILVHAHRQDSQWHAAARDALQELANGRLRWAIPWSCIHEFLAVVTHVRIFVPPTPLQKAIEQVDAWLESPSITMLGESQDHWTSFRTAALAGKIKGAVVHDARIAAVCSQHGVRELWSADRDFSRFPSLTIRNPLVGAS